MNRNPERAQDPRAPALRRLFGGATYFPTDLGPVDTSPSQPGALLPEQGVEVKLPGVNFPPAGATPVDAVGDANIAAGATATLVSIQVPDTLRFRVVGIGFGADDETALRFLTWSIRVTGANDTVPAYFNVPSAVGSIRQLSEIFLLVGSSSLFTVQAISDPTAIIAYRFICRVRGHFYAEREIH